MGDGKENKKKMGDANRLCVERGLYPATCNRQSAPSQPSLILCIEEVHESVTKMLSFWSFLGLILVPRAELTGGSGHAPCVHGGVQYKHGDLFKPSDPVLLRSELPGQCMQCRCRDGVVFCEIESCPLLNCETPVQISQYCCLQCQKAMRKPEKPPSLRFPSPKMSKIRKKSGCFSNGKYYKEGTSWQPVIGPLGVMACVQCGCSRGEVSCNRFQCRELPCSHPKKQFGQCCPVCPALDDHEKGTRSCLPRPSEVFVFKRPKLGKIADIIEYGFVQYSSRNKLEVHTWDTRQYGDKVFQVTVVPKSNMAAKDMVIVGSTSYKHWTRFVRRERRLKNRCMMNCGERVVRLEKTLKLYPVASRSSCYSGEIDTSTL